MLALVPPMALVASLHIGEHGGLAISWSNFGVVSAFLSCLAGLAWMQPFRSIRGEDDPAEDTRWTPSQPQRELTWTDLVLSWLILIVGVLALAKAIRPEQFDAATILLGILIAAVLVASVALSFTLTLIVLLSAGVSFPFAILLQVFFYWLGGGESIWGYWVFTSLFALSMLVPMWANIRSMSRTRGWARPPIILTSSGTCALLVLAAFTLGGSEPAPPKHVDTQAVSRQEAVRRAHSQPPNQVLGAPTAELAARQLLTAWRMDYREGALRAASPTAVDALFKVPFDATLALEGCVAGVCRLVNAKTEVLLHVMVVNHLHHVAAVTPPAVKAAPPEASPEEV